MVSIVNTVFAFLLSCSGGVILVVYSLIMTAYIAIRNQASEQERKAFFHLPLFPFINIACLGFVVLIFVAMLSDPVQRTTAIASLGTCLLFMIIYWTRCITHRSARHS
ncbi:hypothetical protein AmDm5_0044 [Acetobacter malorum]|nr:hypothetical protein AmDm5_0044 [Acetobacter malorum]